MKLRHVGENMDLTQLSIRKHLDFFFEEDDLGRNLFYFKNLPTDTVDCVLKIKSDGILAGLNVFQAVFCYLQADQTDSFSELLSFEGLAVKKDQSFKFKLPFNVALTGERIALNLLQRMSAIATHTNKFVQIAKPHNITILDTRKTTPGLRSFEKYAVVVGGGKNHRLGQNDVFMIKDNHKKYFWGLKSALDFFKKMESHYIPVIAEIHDLSELKQAIELGIKNVMLDNFTPLEIEQAVKLKTDQLHYEISGGINLENITSYLLPGVDAISLGSLTYGAAPFDISLKVEK
jgi:nicotinate-nucleotide pyrophosphorylase (carboxylating)